MSELHKIFLFFSGFFGIIGVLIFFIVAPLTLGRKFDKKFDKEIVTPYDPGIPLLSIAVRSMTYMFAIVFFDKALHRPKKRAAIGPQCSEYNFRADSSIFDLIISFICVYSSLFFLCFGLVSILIRWSLSS